MRFGAATDDEQPRTSRARRRRALRVWRTPMSNAHHQRARAAHRCHMKITIRAPLHGVVRQRVVAVAAAPPRRAFNNRDACYRSRLSAATHDDVLTASRSRRRQTFRGPRTPMSNARVQRVRERQWLKHESRASRTPLQRIVRPRFACGIIPLHLPL